MEVCISLSEEFYIFSKSFGIRFCFCLLELSDLFTTDVASLLKTLEIEIVEVLR